jgi:hypothetical protein
MKVFALYTLARLGLFCAAYGLIWLVFFQWIEWDALSAFYTAIIALVLSAIASFLLLGRLRDALAVQVQERAARARAAFEARRSAEDDDT